MNYIEQDIQKVSDDCCDQVNVNNGYIGDIFHWLLNNGYVICKKVVEEEPQPIRYPEVGEGEFLEYQDGLGYWYKLTDDLKNNKHFLPFKVRINTIPYDFSGGNIVNMTPIKKQ